VNGGVGEKKGYIYPSSNHCLVTLLLLVNEYTPAQPESYKILKHRLNVEDGSEMNYSRSELYIMLGVTFVSHTTFITLVSYM